MFYTSSRMNLLFSNQICILTIILLKYSISEIIPTTAQKSVTPFFLSFVFSTLMFHMYNILNVLKKLFLFINTISESITSKSFIYIHKFYGIIHFQFFREKSVAQNNSDCDSDCDSDCIHFQQKFQPFQGIFYSKYIWWEVNSCNR